MPENQTTGPSDANSVSDLPKGGSSTVPITKTVTDDSRRAGPEMATLQTVEVEVRSLRTHIDDCVNSTNTKLNYTEELFKTKLDNMEIKLNARIELLDKDVQSIKDKSKTKKDRRWDILILCISIIAAVVGTLIVENVIIPWFKK